MNKAQVGAEALCGTGRYYLEQSQGKRACHRYPPSFSGDGAARELHRWSFPLVTAHSWCGEHRPADPELPAR